MDDVRSIVPSELYLTIIENNPDAVKANLQQVGVQVSQGALPGDLLQIILSLKKNLTMIEYVELVSRLLNVEILEQGANSREIISLLDNNVGSLVVENYLANAPQDIALCYAKDYTQTKRMAMFGWIAIVVIAIAVLAMLLKPRTANG